LLLKPLLDETWRDLAKISSRATGRRLQLLRLQLLRLRLLQSRLGRTLQGKGHELSMRAIKSWIHDEP